MALCPLAALALAGCETTQDAAARLKVRSERTLAGRKPVEIDKPADRVRVVDATLVRGDGDAAVVVELANDGEQPVNDLPIAVGVKTAAGEKRYLNDGHDLPYFQTHAQALAPGATGTWVFAAKDPVDDGTAFAEVGAGASPDHGRLDRPRAGRRLGLRPGRLEGDGRGDQARSATRNTT